MTITEFLMEQLDRDEERASSGWSRMGDGRWEYTNEGLAVMTPRAVLADVAAKRAIVELHRPNAEGDLCTMCTETGPDAQGWPCDTVRLLALPYAEHPDFDPSWTPTN